MTNNSYFYILLLKYTVNIKIMGFDIYILTKIMKKTNDL